MVQISDLYEVKISSNKTQLELNETATITVKLIDFKGNGVSGKKVILHTDNGVFVNNNTEIGNTYTVNSVSANGFTIQYKANTPGISTFYATVNDTIDKGNLQIFIKGYKKIQLTTTKAKETTYLYVNEYSRKCILNYVYNDANPLRKGSGSVLSATMETNFIPEAYTPQGTIVSTTYRPDIVFYITDGNLYSRVEEDKTSFGAVVRFLFVWTY